MLTGLRRSLGIFQNVYNIRIYLACAIHQKGEKDPTKNIKKKKHNKTIFESCFYCIQAGYHVPAKA